MGVLYRFPVKTDFGPDQTHAMGAAFDTVCEYLKHSGIEGLDRNEVRDLAALKIIEKAASGESDPVKLTNYAITLLRL